MYNKFGTQVSEKTKKIERIDDLLTQLNKCWIAPLNIDTFTGRYFYEILISLLETASLEISSELNKEELQVDEDHRKKIDELMNKYPIIKYRYDESITGRHKKLVTNRDNWSLLKKELYSYDRDVRLWINTKLKEQLWGDSADITEVDEEGNIVGMGESED
jgi:hypothetical protein